MTLLKSKFKKSGTYGILIFLNVGIVILIIALLFWIGSDNKPNLTTILIASISLVCIQAILLYLFFSHCKILIITTEGISFGNPVFNYLLKSHLWSDFDSYILVREETEHSEIEAIWLMKNNRLVRRISSGIYHNYDDLKKKLKVSKRSLMIISPTLQAKAILGLRVNL